MPIRFNHAVAISSGKYLEDISICTTDSGLIEYIGSKKHSPKNKYRDIDLDGKIVSPGLFDIHVHGGFGIAFGHGENLFRNLRKYSQDIVSTGVTHFLPTLVPNSEKTLHQILNEYHDVLNNTNLPGAQVVGFNLEGPFLNPAMRGAQNPKYLKLPDIESAKKILFSGQNMVKMMAISPELSNAKEVADFLHQQGIILSVAHTNGDYDTVQNALSSNFSHVTHTFNAMGQFHHRNPGAIGAALTSKSVFTELIADMIHVHPASIKILLKCVGEDHVVLITDAMPGAGLPDGIYKLMGFEINVKDGVARNKKGDLAGSSALLNECVYHMVNKVGINLTSALKMATLNPARALKIENLYGTIAPGKKANLIVVDKKINVYLNMVNGQIIFDQLT